MVSQNVDQIVGFFNGTSVDHAGRKLEEILAWPDEALEQTHDYIQWVFPNADRSPVNPHAPVVDADTIQAFVTDAALRASLANAFVHMAAFWGLRVEHASDGPIVRRSEQWGLRKANWLTPHNHNMLRVTRVLKCLRLLGLPEYARAFFLALQDVYDVEGTEAIGSTTFAFWRSAMA